MSGLLGLDCETTGVDRHHGARPFFVSFCNEQWENTYYEWDVNPLTRQVKIVESDTEEIAQTILDAEGIVFQNGKFDIGMLLDILPAGFVWPWEKTDDTLLAGHLLASNHNKDLTSMGVEYCAIDITKYEEAVEKATNKCRNKVRLKNSPIGDWMIAKEGLFCMPSAKQKVWKYDMWLPRAVAKRKVSGFDPSWHTVLRDYGNADPATCLGVFLRQRELLQERGLWEIYQARLELMQVIVDMEQQGVTASRERLKEIEPGFIETNQRSNRVCVNIAASYGYELTLPKAGKNNSLTEFVFDGMKLPVLHLGNERKKKTDAPSLDKKVLEYYEATLPQKSKPLMFVKSLKDKRATDTALGYMRTYQKFWLPITGQLLPIDEDGYAMWLVLYPSLNPTGSDTLRFTSSNPNEQQISKREGFNLRYIFGPAPGREWWSLDAKNIELRIPAYESGERELIELFENPDEPPYYGSTHLLNFHTIYPELWEPAQDKVGFDKVGPYCKKTYAATWYQWCKNFGFATQYGAVDRDDGQGTADIAAHKPGAQSLIKVRFGKLETLNQRWITYADKCGYVETMPDKSVNAKHGYPLLCTRSQWGNIKPTIPLNYHVQGTAMWWMCRAMVRCFALLKAYNTGKPRHMLARLVMQVHDELVFDFPAGEGTEAWKTNLPVIKEIAGTMALGGDDIGVPTPVGIEYHSNNWSEGVTL